MAAFDLQAFAGKVYYPGGAEGGTALWFRTVPRVGEFVEIDGQLHRVTRVAHAPSEHGHPYDDRSQEPGHALWLEPVRARKGLNKRRSVR